MAGRTFAKFHVDVGIGDESIEPTERMEGEGWFDFAGLPRPEFRMISREQQFAEISDPVQVNESTAKIRTAEDGSSML